MNTPTSADRNWAVCLSWMVAIAFSWQPAEAIEEEVSRLARGAFEDAGGFSFCAEFADDKVVLQRSDMRLAPAGKRMPALDGAVFDILEITFGGAAHKGRIRRDWEHQQVDYAVPGGEATVVLSRLTPAVLVDSSGSTLTLSGRFAHLATVAAQQLVVRAEGSSDAALRLDEPWLVVWFEKATPYQGYLDVADHDDEHLGGDKQYLARHRPQPLDVPILVCLEHQPERIRLDDGLHLTFSGPVGKVAIMPLFGARAFEPAETMTWHEDLPGSVLRQCRTWSKVLRDYPLAVTETYRVDPAGDRVTISQQMTWLSMQDDWSTPSTRAAPVPPMLGLALKAGMPITFEAHGRPVVPVDYGLLDTPGLALGVEGVDSYAYHVSGLSQLLQVPVKRPAVADAKALQEKLTAHVREMIDAGHLQPLLYIYGGLGGTAPAYYYWGSTAELAETLAAAWPYLPDELRTGALVYLENEWQDYPPLENHVRKYREGANRAPYEIPYELIGSDLRAVESRESSLLAWRSFGELYGIDCYLRLTGTGAGTELRGTMQQLTEPLLAGQDWALMGPIERTNTGGFFQGVNFFNRNGQATANVRLAGAIGMTRIADRQGWAEQSAVGRYLAAKFAIARVGMAHYTAQLHALGIVRGDVRDDWRTLVHIDRRCGIVLRGHPCAVFHADQELPPFIGLVEEVGNLLGRYARAECGHYLDNLDESMALWFVSEAPKQSATEHRLSPLHYKSGNVLAQFWVSGKTGNDFRRYVDTTRFRGDYYYIKNLSALIESYGRGD